MKRAHLAVLRCVICVNFCPDRLGYLTGTPKSKRKWRISSRIWRYGVIVPGSRSGHVRLIQEAAELEDQEGHMRMPRIALFSDSCDEANGVKRTTLAIETCAKRRNIPLLSVHPGSETRLVHDGSIVRLDLKRSSRVFVRSRARPAVRSVDVAPYGSCRRDGRMVCAGRPAFHRSERRGPARRLPRPPAEHPDGGVVAYESARVRGAG